MDELRRSWTPEHMAGASWVEEGLSAAPTITPLARTTAPSAAAADRQQVLEVMLQTDDDMEIEVGDVVRYVDVQKADDILSIRITRGTRDLANGLISENTPLPQALLGTTTGDEVPLHLPGNARRIFRVVAIRKPWPIAAE